MGDETGVIPGSKVGDLVVTAIGGVTVPARIAVECKNRKLSHKKTVEQLNLALENREATLGLVVFSSEDKTPSGQPLQRLGPSRYAVMYDPDSADDLALRVAYQLARSDILSAVTEVDGSRIDPTFLQQKVQEARTLLDQVTQIKRGISTARNGMDRAETALMSMKEDLLRTLDEIDEEVGVFPIVGRDDLTYSSMPASAACALISSSRTPES